MESLRFDICFCGMSEENFSEEIMIYKPLRYITRNFDENELHLLGIERVGDLIEHLKEDPAVVESLGEWESENFSVATVYLKHEGCLLGLREDKTLSEVSRDLGSARLELVYFVVGGASMHNETGYRFTVHTDEKIHEHMPHVHVSKGGVEIRYSLETLLPIDTLVNPHKRDNKKIIMPFLEKNKERLLKMWSCYINGYSVPEFSSDGKQFYTVS